MKILALIPARGGSKGIVRKNVRDVAGKPLIAYSIEQALSSKLINRVIVSTDDDEIASVSRRWGAEVPFMRPAEYAQDLSPDIDVFVHALQWLKDHGSYEPDIVVHLRPPVPVRSVEVIDQAIQMFIDHPEADSLRSICWPLQSPYKMWRIKDGLLEPLVTVDGVLESYNLARQSLPDVYRQSGYIDITRPRTILGMGMMNGKTILPFFVEELGVDLDYEEDLAKLEVFFAGNQNADGESLEQTSESVKRHPI